MELLIHAIFHRFEGEGHDTNCGWLALDRGLSTTSWKKFITQSYNAQVRQETVYTV